MGNINTPIDTPILYLHHNIKKDIMIDELKRIKDYENLTDGEATKIIDLLYQLSIIILKIYKDEFGGI